MPVLLYFGYFAAVAAAAIWWRSRRGGALVPATGDALALLTFPPFVLEAGRPTTLAYLAPSGLGEAEVRAKLAAEVGAPTSIEVARRGIPVPPPTGAGPPVLADAWVVRCDACGPPPGSPPTTITPAWVVARILARQGAPTASGFSGGDPSRQLAAILYANALSRVAAATAQPPELIPIAGRQ